MAELVQRHVESMAEEIEELRRTNLYTTEELKFITKSRKEFAYKIFGVSKNVKDFDSYISFERDFLKQIQKRRDKYRIAERRGSIEHKILERIRNLHEIALQRFSNDYTLCLDYFKYCKQSRYTPAATAAIHNMSRNFGHHPEVWQIAARWFADEQKDHNTAMKMLNKGLNLHNDSTLLYTEAIQLELSVVKNDDSSLESKKALQQKVCRSLETYISFICDCIKDSNYLIEILNLLESYEFTLVVQHLLIDKMIQNHSNKCSVWHTLAQREKRGLHYPTDKNSQHINSDPTTLCFEKYREGLRLVSSTEKANLWSIYLENLEETECKNKQILFKSALEEASNENLLTERYYVKLLEMVNDKKALEILEKGTNNFPQSVDLWKLRLQYATMTGKHSNVNKVFKNGVESLGELSLPLWLIYLRYYDLLSREDVVASIYQDGIKQPKQVSEVLKPKYLEWLALSNGINDARKKYNILSSEIPYCKELHTTMSKLESVQINPDFEVWVRVHKLACEQFGENDIDVWINYILFYLHYNTIENVKQKIQQIFSEAMKTLSPFLTELFKQKFDETLAEQ